MSADLVARIEGWLERWGYLNVPADENLPEEVRLLREALQALKEFEVRCPECNAVVEDEMDHRTGFGKWTCNIAAKDCDHSQWHGTRPNCPTCGISLTEFE